MASANPGGSKRHPATMSSIGRQRLRLEANEKQRARAASPVSLSSSTQHLELLSKISQRRNVVSELSAQIAAAKELVLMFPDVSFKHRYI